MAYGKCHTTWLFSPFPTFSVSCVNPTLCGCILTYFCHEVSNSFLNPFLSTLYTTFKLPYVKTPLSSVAFLYKYKYSEPA